MGSSRYRTPERDDCEHLHRHDLWMVSSAHLMALRPTVESGAANRSVEPVARAPVYGDSSVHLVRGTGFRAESPRGIAPPGLRQLRPCPLGHTARRVMSSRLLKVCAQVARPVLRPGSVLPVLARSRKLVSRQGKGAGKAHTGREKAGKSQELCLLALHRPSRFRWMLSGHAQNAAQVDESRTIQVEGRRSCATCGCAALNFQEVIGPCEVPRPSLATRVEQRNSSPGQRIASLRLGIFVTITRRARPSQLGHRMSRATAGGEHARRRRGHTSNLPDAGSTRNDYRHARAPAALAAEGAAHVPSAPPSWPISAFTAARDFPLLRASFPNASTRSASSCWTCCAAPGTQPIPRASVFHARSGRSAS